MAETVWEEHSVSLEDYASAFNKELDEAWERALEGRLYLMNLVDDKPRASCVINVGDD